MLQIADQRRNWQKTCGPPGLAVWSARNAQDRRSGRLAAGEAIRAAWHRARTTQRPDKSGLKCAGAVEILTNDLFQRSGKLHLGTVEVGFCLIVQIEGIELNGALTNPVEVYLNQTVGFEQRAVTGDRQRQITMRIE